MDESGGDSSKRGGGGGYYASRFGLVSGSLSGQRGRVRDTLINGVETGATEGLRVDVHTKLIERPRGCGGIHDFDQTDGPTKIVAPVRQKPVVYALDNRDSVAV